MFKHINKHFYSIVIILLQWFTFVYPSIFGSNWGYYDDPSGLFQMKHLFDNYVWLAPDPVSGRYFPVYLLYKGLVYKIFGESPFGFFFIQSFVVLFSAILIYLIIKSVTNNTKYGIVGALLFFTSSSLYENIFTLSKSEILALFFILLTFYYFIKYYKSENINSKYKYGIMIILTSLFAIWSKETSSLILILGIVGCLFSAFFIEKRQLSKDRLSVTYLRFTMLEIIAIAISRIPNLVFYNSTSQKNYISYKIDFQLILSNIKYYLFQQPDIFIISLILLIIIIFDIIFLKKNNESESRFIASIGISIFAFSLFYIAGLLIWRWPLGYYMYIVAATLSIAVGIELPRLHLINSKLFHNLFIIILITIKIYSVTYGYYVGTSQKAVNKIYNEAISNYINIAKNNERLIMEQWPFYTEEVYQTNILVNQIYDKNNLKIEGINDIFNPHLITEDIVKLYGIKEIPSTEERLPQKGDYVLLFIGNKDSAWHIRGVSPLVAEESKLLKMGYEMELVSSNYEKNKVLYVTLNRKIRYKELYFGYRLYKVTRDSEILLWSGKYEDGWISSNAKCEIRTNGSEKNVKFKISTLPRNVPNVVTIMKNGKEYTKVNIKESGDYYIDIANEPNEDKIELEFIVDKTFVPKDLGINEDTRKLGVIIEMQKE